MNTSCNCQKLNPLLIYPLKGTNVVLSHGTQDPWSFLAKTSDPKHWSVVIAEIQGNLFFLTSCSPITINFAVVTIPLHGFLKLIPFIQR